MQALFRGAKVNRLAAGLQGASGRLRRRYAGPLRIRGVTFMKRRHFFLGLGAATGALVVGWGLMPVRQRQQPGLPLPTQAGETAFGGWLKRGAY